MLHSSGGVLANFRLSPIFFSATMQAPKLGFIPLVFGESFLHLANAPEFDRSKYSGRQF